MMIIITTSDIKQCSMYYLPPQFPFIIYPRSLPSIPSPNHLSSIWPTRLSTKCVNVWFVPPCMWLTPPFFSFHNSPTFFFLIIQYPHYAHPQLALIELIKPFSSFLSFTPWLPLFKTLPCSSSKLPFYLFICRIYWPRCIICCPRDIILQSILVSMRYDIYIYLLLVFDACFESCALGLSFVLINLDSFIDSCMHMHVHTYQYQWWRMAHHQDGGRGEQHCNEVRKHWCSLLFLHVINKWNVLLRNLNKNQQADIW